MASAARAISVARSRAASGSPASSDTLALASNGANCINSIGSSPARSNHRRAAAACTAARFT